MQRYRKHIHFFTIRYNVAANKRHGKKRMKNWEEFCRMTFIKVRRQLTKGGGKARGDLQTKPAPQPPNLIQYKSPGIKLFRLMARQTNVVETRLRLYDQDQVPRSATLSLNPPFPTLFDLREPLLPPSPSASPPTRPPRSPARFWGSSIVRKEEKVRRVRDREDGIYTLKTYRQLYSELKIWQS